MFKHLWSFLILTGFFLSQPGIAAVPESINVDGNLDEWQAPPHFNLTPANQVTGSSPTTSPSDFSAQIWLKINERGAWIAGKIKDERVLFPQNDQQLLNSDHIEFWLSFPEPRFPPIGYANQFGFQEISSEKACQEGFPNGGSAEDCRKWLSEQKLRRPQLKRLFTRQYHISPLGIQEMWFHEVSNSRLIRWPQAPQDYLDEQAIFKNTSNGYQFEAYIPVSSFPATGQLPLNKARLLIDIVDNDRNNKQQESFFSSSRQRKYGQASTFNEITLEKSINYPGTPPIAVEFLQKNPQAFIQPGNPNQLFGLENMGIGYQYNPQEASPEIISQTFDQRPIFQIGDHQLFRVPDNINLIGFNHKLAVFKEKEKISEHELQTPCAYREPDRIFTHLENGVGVVTILCSGIQSPFGSGMCGACPVGDMESVAIDTQGEIYPLPPETTIQDASEMTFPEIWVNPDGSSFGFKYLRYDLDTPDDNGIPVKKLWNWRGLMNQAQQAINKAH